MGYCRRMSVTCFLQESKGWDITLGYVEEESQYWISHIQWNALIHDKYLAYRHATNVTVYAHYFQEGDSYTLPILIFSYSLPEPFLTLQLNLTTSYYLFFFPCSFRYLPLWLPLPGNLTMPLEVLRKCFKLDPKCHPFNRAFNWAFQPIVFPQNGVSTSLPFRVCCT